MQKKKLFRWTVAGLCLANLLIFVSFYVISYLPSVRILEVPDVVYYPVYYLTRLVEFSLAPLTAAVVFSAFHESLKSGLISAALLSITRAIYLIPYYYLYENAYGNDSLESLGLSALITILGIAFMLIHVELLVLILRFVTRRLIAREIILDTPYLKGKEYKKELAEKVSERLPSELSRREYLDLSAPVSGAFFSVALIEFFYPFIAEIVNTVHFFTSYKGFFTTGEIFSIVFAFIFTLVELLTIYFVGMLLKNVYQAKPKNAMEQVEN